MTESGLNNSRGAPRANHDRVFGNMRLRTDASAGSGVLVTELETPPVLCAQPRHVGPLRPAPLTEEISALVRSGFKAKK
jgi:hypothetical protein